MNGRPSSLREGSPVGDRVNERNSLTPHLLQRREITEVDLVVLGERGQDPPLSLVRDRAQSRGLSARHVADIILGSAGGLQMLVFDVAIRDTRFGIVRCVQI